MATPVLPPDGGRPISGLSWPFLAHFDHRCPDGDARSVRAEFLIRLRRAGQQTAQQRDCIVFGQRMIAIPAFG
jgi:hypothetical protein